MSNRFALIEDLEPEGPKPLPKTVLLIPMQSRYHPDFIKVGQLYRLPFGEQFDYCRVIQYNVSIFYLKIKWLTGYKLIPTIHTIWDTQKQGYFQQQIVNDTTDYNSIENFNYSNLEYVSEY